MRFPLRRHHTPDAILERMTTIEGRFASEPAPENTESFELPEVAYGWGQPPIAPHPAEPPATPMFKTIQPLPRSAEEPVPAPEPPPPAAPTTLFDLRLREQSTSSDVRAERLVRQVRSEVEQLKKSLDALATAPDEMLELDVEALVADPEHALVLPPAVLVRAVVEISEELEGARSELKAEREKRLKVQRRLRQVRQLEAARQARLDTLEQVIAALHGNLEDLRLERDRSRLPMQQMAALRHGQQQLPSSGTNVSQCD